MASLEILRNSLETTFGTKLPTEDDVKRAYGDLTGFAGPTLDHEFAVALGRVKSGTPVEEHGVEKDDPLDLIIDAEVAKTVKLQT